MNKINKPKEEWKKILDNKTFSVTRESGTEEPFTGKYLNEPVVEDAYNLAQQTKEKIAADTAARKKATFDKLREMKIMADKNWQSQVPYAGGGMVGIRKPNAIAPTGGPMSQGLRSLYIDDKDY